ncbi:hypothetical protein [Pseudobacteriovorax antillogorgiicola]|uniref:DUF4878 domain-containing protein n=1 Tax=Pseudobacteriovorax antillogorgiicola TaxID=1513793 RepID=A0A1Y6BYB3_9BACT|nr:hypothetical protein [Pseudobacteriovorax antillogorgiicola]TCS50334.1 hypothetical protein EDD56_113152 [Pseudobacteriovorax antillogorgiicola]SMF34568.1 hypothetical protein SAMN06296036_110151 [Pseudobacteriovorax antillogorgiicola]
MTTAKLYLKLIVSFLILAGCTSMCGKGRKDLTPEEVVQAYLDISLNMTDLGQRVQLLNLTTGSLHAAIEKASDETVSKAFIDKRYHLEAYSVVERRDRTPRETEITFVLTYRDLGNNPDQAPAEAAQITTENTVAVVKYKGAWAIRDVLGKNTTIDFPTQQGAEIKPSTAP